MSLAKALGVKPEPKKVEEVEVKRPKISPFDFVKDIQHPQKNLIVDEWSEKQYNPFMVNKALSFAPDTILIANEMNARPHLSKKAQNLFLIHMIRPKKRYSPWIKGEKHEDLELIKDYYNYGDEKARSLLRILTREQIDILRERSNRGG